MSVRFLIGCFLILSVCVMATGVGLLWGLGAGLLSGGFGMFVLLVGASQTVDEK